MFKSQIETNYNKYKEQVCHLLWGLIINSQEVVRNPEIRQLHKLIRPVNDCSQMRCQKMQNTNKLSCQQDNSDKLT